MRRWALCFAFAPLAASCSSASPEPAPLELGFAAPAPGDETRVFVPAADGDRVMPNLGS